MTSPTHSTSVAVRGARRSRRMPASTARSSAPPSRGYDGTRTRHAHHGLGLAGTATLDRALVDIAEAYGDQTERDHAELVQAIKRGRVKSAS